MTYTHGHHESVLRSHKWRTVDNSAAYLAPCLTGGFSVLDLGCVFGILRFGMLTNRRAQLFNLFV